MTQVNFLDSTTIEVVIPNGEMLALKSYIPVHHTKQRALALSLARHFDESLSHDKFDMTYWVLMKTMAKDGFAFYHDNSEKNVERERIGERIRQLRESKGMEAKQLAMLTNIDASNLCRIEQGKYSVGIDILVKISQALGVKVDLVDL
ncbi:MAG TPA: helix-turn-helix transcriptional regulator [Chitinophagaceae bacterium]|jgi:DNA-binding XRE family transcriptional regulator|nr:helix-turn-helix transcriptional regulator [Chitinophagaceae bacterium]